MEFLTNPICYVINYVLVNINLVKPIALNSSDDPKLSTDSKYQAEFLR